MQKKIIALAVAGLMSGAAFAQSNVTIYGIVDAGYLHSKSGGDSSNQIISGGLSTSRIGFKGEEDLGNGLKALFQLEYNLANDTNTGLAGAATSRTQILGLTGNFGTVVAGHMNSPGMNAAIKFDPFGASVFSVHRTLSDGWAFANNAAGNGAFDVNTISAGARIQNAVAYVSPSFSGFNVVAGYAFGAVSGDNVNTDTNDQEKTWAVQLNYDNGPLAASLTYHDTNNVGNNPNAANSWDASDWMIAASYDFGMAKLFGTYQRSNNDNIANVVNLDENDRLWTIGVSAPIGNGSLQFAYGKAKDDAVGNNDNSKAWGLQYQYNMSKRTTAYAGYTRVSNERNSALGNVMGVTPTSAGDNAHIWGGGLRHSF